MLPYVGTWLLNTYLPRGGGGCLRPVAPTENFRQPVVQRPSYGQYTGVSTVKAGTHSVRPWIQWPFHQ